VDLSFVYKINFSSRSFDETGQNSPYDFLEKFICIMLEVTELQLSSPQLEEFIRLAKV
jgi:hypothetical protein